MPRSQKTIFHIQFDIFHLPLKNERPLIKESGALQDHCLALKTARARKRIRNDK
jgi:hypothetical protein